MKYKIIICVVFCLCSVMFFTACSCQSKAERDLERAEKSYEQLENNYQDTTRRLEEAKKDLAKYEELKKKVDSAK